MNKILLPLLAGLVLVTGPAHAQSIDVTPSGVDIGATATGASGAVIQQSGDEVSILKKDGTNPPELHLIVKDTGNVGIGTSTPTEKLEVVGNTVTTGTATVGSLVVGTSTLFTEGFFESTAQTFPGSGATLTVTHGLSGTPRFMTVSLRCITAEFGWQVDDEIMVNSIHMRSDNHGVTVGVNPTSIKLRQLGNIWVHRRDSAAVAYITPNNWRFIFRAWR